MYYLATKALLSGVIVMAVSELARRSPALGALVVSLPLISILAMLWLFYETRDAERIAVHAEATFWYVLPSLPMFLLLPALLRQGVGFALSLASSIALTSLLYLLMVFVLARFGIRL